MSAECSCYGMRAARDSYREFFASKLRLYLYLWMVKAAER